ncbi:hypothetical protein [Hydrogenophaga sp. ANAO-22]|uniref:hypothetical protein n=1 Tax=Hydrogenophaga sp. ANAO-22 TaxID=3166645 RepID=UPI0036D29936
MSEPTSSTAAGGYLLYKAAIAFGIPAGLATVVVMLWVQPKSKREWAMALICTVVSSVGGGAMAVEYLQLQHLAVGGVVGLMALGGLIFACGLPGWVIVRAGFAWADKRKDHDLGELARDVKEIMK